MTTTDSIAERLRRTARSVRPDELEQAARLMAAAFDTDPSIRYLLGGAHEGRDDWRYFLTVLRALYGRCLMLTSGRRLQSLLILFPPDLKAVPTLGFFRNGGFALCHFFGLRLLLCSMRYEANCARIKKRLSTADTWYCMCFVVQPERQGQGIGSKLIRPVLRELNACRVPVYLETHRKSNTALYAHLGFRVADVSTIPGTTITQYAMLSERPGI